MEWIKHHGTFDQTNAKIDRNVLHFEPFNIRDTDVYTCVARNLNGQYAKQAIYINDDLNYFKIHDNIIDRAPKIVGIYESGHLREGSEYRLECLAGIEAYILILFKKCF